MPTWILDGIQADAAKGIGKTFTISGGNRIQYGLGSRVASVGNKVFVKTRLPNINFHLRNSDGEYVLSGGCVAGDGIEVRPYACTSIASYEGPNFLFLSTPHLCAVGPREFISQRRQGDSTIQTFKLTPDDQNPTGVTTVFVTIVHNNTNGAGKARPWDGNTYYTLSVHHPNGVDAYMTYFNLGQFNEDTSYVCIQANVVIAGPQYLSVLAIMNSAAPTGPENNFQAVWPFVGYEKYDIFAVDSVFAGIVAMLLVDRTNSPTVAIQDSRLVVYSIYTGTILSEVEIHTFAPEFLSGGVYLRPSIRACITSVSPTTFLFSVTRAHPKVYRQTGLDTPVISLELLGHSEYFLLARYNQKSIVSLKKDHAIYFSIENASGNLYVHVTEDAGLTWESSMAASNSEWLQCWFPYAATCCFYERNENNEFVPTKWAYPAYSQENDRQMIRVYNTPVPTAESFEYEISAFTENGEPPMSNSFPPVLVYTGEEFDSTIPLKPGHPGTLEL